jgi:hypothetical protein
VLVVSSGVGDVVVSAVSPDDARAQADALGSVWTLADFKDVAHGSVAFVILTTAISRGWLGTKE